MILDLYLYKDFNNYSNRYIKKYDTIEEYGVPLHIQTKVNFIESDFVDTVQVINYPSTKLELPDYVLCATNDSSHRIIYRYFVISSERTSANQLKLVLHRDVIADNFDNVTKNYLWYIEKGYVSNDNPLIFNSENISVNQIKTSETFIKDITQSPWVVAYISKPTNDFTGINATFTKRNEIITLNDWSDFEYEKYLNKDIKIVRNLTELNWSFNYKQKNNEPIGLKVIFNADTGGIRGVSNTATNEPYDKTNYATSKDNINLYYEFAREDETYTLLRNKFIEDITTNYTSEGDSVVLDPFGELTNNIKYYENKIFYVNNNYYRIKFQEGTFMYKKGYNETDGSVISQLINEVITSRGLTKTFTSETDGTTLIKNYELISDLINTRYMKLQTESLSDDQLDFEYTINYESKDLTEDAVYNVVCAPYSDDLILDNFYDGAKKISKTNDKDLALQAILALAKENSQAVYDIQILPYFPLAPLFLQNGSNLKGHLDIDNIPDLYTQYFKKNNSNVNVGVYFTAKKSTFSFPVFLNKPIQVDDLKISNVCDMWRLCSPNYNGVFEFSVAKNGGNITSFNVDCSYIPLNPWIHIAPDFQLLYGSDFNDARGLTLQGDFSVARVTDKWLDYQAQNVNYQNTFNRQVESMELQQNWNMAQTAVGAVTGTVSGAVSGAASGFMVGGPIGAIAGGITGGISSAVGGGLDIAKTYQLQKDQLDLTKDLFNYQLGNIKALPQSLAKTTAFNANSKYFPFLEYYTCTDVERQTVKDKIKYQGMTLGVAGKLENYVNLTDWTFLKAKLIRGQDITTNRNGEGLDSNILRSIATELDIGLYIKLN